ncbi:unnamed protein product [Effrenium voratum]|nr:unnamed protein product [Effrenium voratum]
MAQLWEVVGGVDKGGILVRSGQLLSSPEETSRLSTGALIRQEELVGERLRYTRLSGSGPLTGWVSLKVKDKPMVAKTDRTPPAEPAPAAPAAPAVPPAKEPAPKESAPEEEEEQEGAPEAEADQRAAADHAPVGDVTFDDEEDGEGEAAAPEPVAEAAPEPKAPKEPAAPGEIAVGCQVEISGLKSKPELNGKRATVMLKDEAAGRFEVRIDGPADDRIRCKPENLTVVVAKTSPQKSQGDANFKEGRLEQAIACYRQALEEAKGDDEFSATIQSNIAAAYAKKGDHHKALEAANEAVRLRPDWAKAHSRKGSRRKLCLDENLTESEVPDLSQTERGLKPSSGRLVSAMEAHEFGRDIVDGTRFKAILEMVLPLPLWMLTRASPQQCIFSLVEALLNNNRNAPREELPGLCRLSSIIAPEDGGFKALCRPDFRREKPEQGDLVILGFGFGVHPEYQSCSAVITRVDQQHCTVAVLDPSRSFRIGECQVALDDVKQVHKEWRVGACMIIGGLQSSKMRHLNGHTVHICEHRRHGHPCFVQASSGSKDKLTLCVRLDEPIPDHATALLLEPRFLSPFTKVASSSLPQDPPATLLSSRRRQGHEETKVEVRSFREAPYRAPPASCSGGFLGFISWLVEAPKAEEEHPVVCKSTSIINVDEESPRHSAPPTTSGLLPIPEMAPEGEGINQICSVQIPEQGDLVILGRGVDPVYQLCSAVVKEVKADHCAVAVLDDSRSYSVGECTADFRDIIPVHQDWRIGTRLVVGGLQSSHMRHLNGLYAVVCPHKRFGHPCLISKPSASNRSLWLTLCLRFEDASRSNIHGALLEPRFLTPALKDRVKPFPRTQSGASESTVTSSSSYRSGYQKSMSMPGTPASSVSSAARSTSQLSEERFTTLASLSSLKGTLDVPPPQKPQLPRCASNATDETESVSQMSQSVQSIYQTQTSLNSNSSRGSYQKTTSLPSTMSGKSGGIPLDRMEKEVKDLRAMLKVLATKNEQAVRP